MIPPMAKKLAGDVVVVSPHLDDAAMSLGAAISRASRSGARVTVLTVLAGDPASTERAGEWDRSSGFSTAGEAALARREEDFRACERLGARPVWLAYGDEQYERGATDDEIRAAVLEAAGSALVLLPGFPLSHDDHRWLHDLLADAFEPDRLGLYAEQPYAAFDGGPPPGTWARLKAGLGDRRRKLGAYRAYASQHGPLGRVTWPILRYELRHGGESALLP
jgi:LmbE family N-acetylglucosaminyl deacetylase